MEGWGLTIYNMRVIKNNTPRKTERCIPQSFNIILIIRICETVCRNVICLTFNIIESLQLNKIAWDLIALFNRYVNNVFPWSNNYKIYTYFYVTINS